MELVQLEMFVAVAASGGITNAAVSMGRAASNISTRIQQLERELGVTLLVRDKRQASLSADGETFLEYARQIVSLCGEARQFAHAKGPRGLFRLGALESTAAVRIPALLANYHLTYPNVALELKAQSSGHLLNDLLSGHLTAAFTDGAPTSSLLAGIKAFTEQMVIISPRSVDVTTSVFRESHPTVFVFGTDCSYRQRFEDWMQDGNIQPKRVVEISSYYSMLACVAAGAGVAMMPRALLDTLPGAMRVRANPIRGTIGTAETWLTWRRDCRSANLRAMVELLKSHLAPGPEPIEAGRLIAMARSSAIDRTPPAPFDLVDTN